MQIGTLTPSGLTKVSLVDQQTLTVTASDDNVVNEDDWEEVGLDEFSVIGPTQINSDGLRYRMCVEVIDWWDATGEGKKEFHLSLKDFDGFEDLDGLVFESMELAIEALLARKDELRESNPGGVEYLCDPVKPSRNIDEIEIPTYCVALYVVPVSIPKSELAHCIGSEDMEAQLDECYAKHGDYREFAWDIHTYGHGVPIPMATDGKVENGILCTDKDLDATLKRVKQQAHAVMHMFGFFMDRPVNRLGESGWNWLERAKAWPSMHEENEQPEKVEQCHDCDKHLACKKYNTIYDATSVWICDRCRRGWYSCAGCKVLMPVEPESAFGVAWTEINHLRYCSKCVSNKYNSPNPPNVVPGGTVLTFEDMRGCPALHKVKLDSTWEHEIDGDEAEWWACEWDRVGGDDPKVVADRLIELVKSGSPENDYLYGLVEIEPFRAKVGVYWRKRG